MGTTILDEFCLHAKMFYGGNDRGRCISIWTDSENSISLREIDFLKIIIEYQQYLIKEKENTLTQTSEANSQ